MQVEYRVLGPLEVLLDGVRVPVPAGRGRALLVTLLMRPNTIVPVDELVDRVWEGAPSDRAAKTLQTVVMRLRQALGAANRVRTMAGGYCAEVTEEQLDLLRFRALAESEPAAALALWRGELPAELSTSDRFQLEEERLAALERRVEAELRTGFDPDVLVPELRRLTGAWPVRERFWAQLIRALHGAGRTAEALAAFDDISTRLADELGVDPGEELRTWHRSLLVTTVPRQLPASTPHFVGRSAHLSELTRMVDGGTVVISAIKGMAGVGKTTLAVHWAREVSDQFPDGQLHINLRGFDVHRAPVTPSAALGRFLDALGVAADRVPADLEAQSTLFRGLVQNRRLLLLLDNARDAAQVRPLLPDTPSCLVLITSRNELAGLGVRPLRLDTLSESEALDLLTRTLGAERVAAEADAVDRIIAWCGGLPLALTIIAAHASLSQLPLSTLVDELADERTRLDALETGEEATSARTVFSWSYQQLSAEAARMFRLGGLHPGPDISVAAATSMAAVPDALPALQELARAHLAVEHVPGRFACHDLLRVYAADRAMSEESADARREAILRAHGHYIETLQSSDKVIANHRFVDGIVPLKTVGVRAEPLPDAETADAWFLAEQQVLRAVITQAATDGHDVQAWQLVWFAYDLIDRHFTWQEWSPLLHEAIAAAERLGDVEAVPRLQFSLAISYGRIGRWEEAARWFEEGDRAYGEIGRVSGQVRCRSGLAWTLEQRGLNDEGVRVQTEALELQKTDPSSTPHRIGMALQHLACIHTNLGNHEKALELLDEWDAVTTGAAAENWLSQIHYTRGRALSGLGRYAEGAELIAVGLEMFREHGVWTDVADALIDLGDARLGLGQPDEARASWAEALDLLDHHGHRNAVNARTRLADLDGVGR